ncbi:hypothetical protein Tsubulata_032615 [Turnera subulata]|uniref:Cystatin domain-containing protein n=1 Tax=Turnera subulata TaxID=218843 RepID=A0A9Q0J146_9ROSI|nr:hypothetical protein Tsubulata_032615 [Turnera subulata]
MTNTPSSGFWGERRREERMEKIGDTSGELGAAPLSRSAERGKEEEEESEAKKPRLGEKEPSPSSSSKEEEYEFQWENSSYIKEDVSNLNKDDYEPPVTFSIDDDLDVLKDDNQRDQYLRYQKQVDDSEGFDVSFTPDFPLMGGYDAVDMETEKAHKDNVIACLNFAILNNNNKPKRPKLHNAVPLYATRQPCSGYNYCITFRAENMDFIGEPATIYQTRVFYHWMDGPKKVLIFRPKISG